MRWQLSRREFVAAFGASLFVRGLPAAEATPAKVCLTLAYMSANPANKDMKFDAEGFREKYLPVVKSAYGSTLDRVELRVPPRPERMRSVRDVPPPPSPVAAVVTMWINDGAAFAAANQASGGAVTAELQKLTKGQPHVQIEEVIGEHGQPRAAVGMSTSGQFIQYPYSEGAKWDADFYLNTYLPKMAAAYGDDALKRVEVRRGVGVPGGGKPLFINTVSIYAENAAKFQTASFRSGQELMADGMKISTIMPIFSNLNVAGVG